jgi:hypothetical protein
MRLVKDNQGMGFLGPLQDFGYGRGKPSKTAFVTEKASEVLQMNYEHCIPPGKGSAQHRYLQKLIKEKINGTVEFLSGDVVRYTPAGSVVYEIELLNNDHDHFLKNIEIDLPLFNRIVVVIQSVQDKKKVMKKAQEELDSELFNEGIVQFKTIQEVLHESF